MSTLVSIDPGASSCGIAVFKEGELRTAFLVAPNTQGTAGYTRGLVVADAASRALQHCRVHADSPSIFCEIPRVYPQASQQKGDPNDLIHVAITGAMVCEALALSERAREVSYVYPHEWKGNIDKKIMLARIEKTLTVAERSRVQSAGAKTHNILDAVGIGLWTLARLNTKAIRYE